MLNPKKPTAKPTTNKKKNNIHWGWSSKTSKCTAPIIGLKKPIDINKTVADKPGIIWVKDITAPIKNPTIWIHQGKASKVEEISSSGMLAKLALKTTGKARPIKAKVILIGVTFSFLITWYISGAAPNINPPKIQTTIKVKSSITDWTTKNPTTKPIMAPIIIGKRNKKHPLNLLNILLTAYKILS